MTVDFIPCEQREGVLLGENPKPKNQAAISSCRMPVNGVNRIGGC
jgi:hypothetical protein